MKGMLMTRMIAGSGRWVTLHNNRDMPVAPPSMKLFGNRKLFNPNPAEKMPMMMKIVLRVAWKIVRRLLYISLASRKFVLRFSLCVRVNTGIERVKSDFMPACAVFVKIQHLERLAFTPT